MIYRTWLYIWVTWRVSYKKQKLLTLREHTWVVGIFLFCFRGLRVANLFSFLCCPIMCPYVLSPVGWCRLYTISALVGGLMLNLRYLCFRIVVFNTYCVVFLFCFSSSSVHYVPSFIWIVKFWLTPLIFSNVYIMDK